MTVHSQPFEPSAPDDFDALEAALSDGHALRRLAVLEEMTEIGVVLMRDLRRLAQQAAPPAADGDDAGGALAAEERAKTFARLTRSMRLTLALDAKMREDLRRQVHGPAEAEAAAAKGSAAAYDDSPQAPQMQAYMDVMGRNAVTAVICELMDDQINDPREIERLRAALYERLHDSEDYDNLLKRGFGEVLASICQELDVSLELGPWRSESWADGSILSRPVRPPGARRAAPPAWPPFGERDGDDDPPPDG